MQTAQQQTGESGYSTVQTSIGVTDESDDSKIDNSNITDMSEEELARSK